MPNKTGGEAYGDSYQIRIPAELTGGARELLQRRTQAEAERLAEDRLIALRKHGTEFPRSPQMRNARLLWRGVRSISTTGPTPVAPWPLPM